MHNENKEGVQEYHQRIQAIFAHVQQQKNALDAEDHLSRLALTAQIQILEAVLENGKSLLGE